MINSEVNVIKNVIKEKKKRPISLKNILCHGFLELKQTTLSYQNPQKLQNHTIKSINDTLMNFVCTIVKSVHGAY